MRRTLPQAILIYGDPVGLLIEDPKCKFEH